MNKLTEVRVQKSGVSHFVTQNKLRNDKMKILILLAFLIMGCPTDDCCKTCKEGKACGDSCISKDKTCDVGPGCACDG